MGIVNPSSDSYRVRAAILGTVSFDIVDAAGKTGRIQFATPRAMSRFEVDPRTDATPPNGPGLYKEWRLSGPARLSGVAAGAGSFAIATLILHGSGNSCYVVLRLHGLDAGREGQGHLSFTFLGKLVR